jgi:hypothetical protein
MRSRWVLHRSCAPLSQTSLLLTGRTAVPGGRTIDIGPMMGVPKDMSVPRITIITAAVGHQARHTATAHPTTTYPNRGAQWEATVAGTNNPLSGRPQPLPP